MYPRFIRNILNNDNDNPKYYCRILFSESIEIICHITSVLPLTLFFFSSFFDHLPVQLQLIQYLLDIFPFFPCFLRQTSLLTSQNSNPCIFSHEEESCKLIVSRTIIMCSLFFFNFKRSYCIILFVLRFLCLLACYNQI